MLKVLTSWDDGSSHDFKVAYLLKQYSLPGIFFIPTACELSKADISILSNHFIIGGHTVSHPPDLKLLSDRDIRAEVSDNRKYLQDITNQEIGWFAYPKGKHDARVRSMVRSAGFSFARTTLVNNIKPCLDTMQMHPSIHVKIGRREYESAQWIEKAKVLFAEANRTNGFFHLWGHSREIEKEELWGQLEEFFNYINMYGTKQYTNY